MSVVFINSEEALINTRWEYRQEFKRLITNGILTVKIAQDWQYFDKLPDDPQFDKLKALWAKCQELYGKTERGRREIEEAAKDSPIVSAPAIVAHEESDPLDDIIVAKLSELKSWFGPVVQLAAMVNANVDSFLASFRRVRPRLESCRAFESLGPDETSLYVQVVPR